MLPCEYTDNLGNCCQTVGHKPCVCKINRDIVLKPKDRCPWGKEVRSQCTPSRAEDCGQSNICGKNKHLHKHP